MLSSNKVAQALDISVSTLNNWYKWTAACHEELPEGMPVLPVYVQHTPRGPRYWNEEDISQLEAFRDWLPKGRGGVMGTWNARFWGARGKRALKNKQQAFNESDKTL